MYLHTPAVEAGSWWRVDTASGSDTGTTVYAYDGTGPIPNYYVLTGSTVRNTSWDGTARFWSATQTLYLKQLTYQGVPNGTVVTSTGVTPAAPVGGAPVDIATISATVAALPTTYAPKAATARGLDSRRSVPLPTDTYLPWWQGAPASYAFPSTHGGNLIRWVPPIDTTFYGGIVNVITQSGNLDLALYDESLTRLGSTGSTACPATGIQGINLTTGIAVTGGNPYWIYLGGDNTTSRFAGWTVTNNIVGARMNGGAAGATGMFPAPATIIPMTHGLSIGTPNSGPIVMPMTDPALVAKAPTPLTMSINSGNGSVFCQDPATGRLFGCTGNYLAYSDDSGATWTQTTFNVSNPILGIIVAGSYLLIGTGTVATPVVGAIYRMPLAGPYTVANSTATLTGQEGAVRMWNFVAYDNGQTVFAGNYDSAGNGASQVRIRKSTDGGQTWTIVMDLGPSDNALRHVHSIVRDPNDATKVWANIGDSGVQCGNYKSTDGGATFSIVSTFGSMRLTPVLPVSDGYIWASDQYRMGGNLHWMDWAGTTLRPRSHVDSPWNGDVYGMCKDNAGVLWYLCWQINTSYTRTAIFASPDEGRSSYLVADLGSNNLTTSLVRAGNYLYVGGYRYDVSGLSFT